LNAARDEGSAVLTPDGAVDVFDETAAAPVSGFAAPDRSQVAPVEETAVSATGAVAIALAGLALLRHVEHAEKSNLACPPVLLIVAHAGDDLRALYLVDYGAWTIF